MKFALTHCNIGKYSDPGNAVPLVQLAESVGFESIWTVEHVALPIEYEHNYPETADGRLPLPLDMPMSDPLLWMSFIAGQTERVRLGTGVLVVPQRNPLILAKEAATLDVLCQGRLELGVGAGWLREEFAALGASFDDRGTRLNDSIGAMRALWTGEPVSYASETVSFQEVISCPVPIQPTIPIHVGGFTLAASRRAGRLGDGFFPGGLDLERLATLLEKCRDTAIAHDREPDKIEITTRFAREAHQIKQSTIDRLKELGVDRITVPTFLFDNARMEDDLKRFSEEVLLPNSE